ncbi:hypothetical protein AB4Z54_31730, partial [Streptomyces sp. MCAF7]
DGLRHWPFAADGTLTDVTEATADATRALRATADAYTAAVTAERQAVMDEQELLADRGEAERALRRSEQAVVDATAEHTAAETAYESVVREAGLDRETADIAVREAEAELARAEQAVRDAEALPTADQVNRARLAWRQAQAEAQSIERTAPESAPRPGLAEAQERAATANLQWLDLQRRHEGRAAALSDARAALPTARTAVDTARAGREQVRLETDRAVAEARSQEQRRARAVARRTRFRDDDLIRLSDIERTLRDTRQDRQTQARAQEDAWRGLSGLAGTLDAARRAAGTGQGGSIRGSLSSTPARWPGDGRQPTPAVPVSLGGPASQDTRPATETAGQHGVGPRPDAVSRPTVSGAT